MFGLRRIRRSSHHSRIARAGSFTADTRAIRASTIPALVDAAVELGYSRELALAGLPYTDEELRLPTTRVSWNELLRVHDNLERSGMPLGDFERAGAMLAKSPLMVVSRFADFFLRPEHLVFASLQWVGPALFPVLDNDFEYRNGHARLELIVPQELPGSATYFHVCKGTISSIPTLIGHPPAAVQAEISARRSVFEVRCLDSQPGVVRFGRLARALFSVPRVIDALVTQEKAARQSFEAMLESQAQFRRILDAMPDGVVVLRGDSIAYVNPALARLLGHERPSSLLGAAWSELQAAGGRLNLGSETAPAERRFLRGDGTEVVLELSSRESITYEGFAAELVVARDVTLRYELQQRLALADRMSSLGTLAAGVAHEINNPLALVMSNLELAARKPEEAPRLVRSAIEGACRVRDIVRELRVFSQPDNDAPEPVDLGEVVASSVALARGKVQTRARLETELEPVPMVAAGHGKLGQVVLNLIINAFEALPEERSPADNRIVVRLSRAGENVRLEVEDNGVGIAPDARARLFEPFFTTRAGRGGSGLGLAVVHDIVSRSGGTIEVVSEPGRGALFRVELPPTTAAVAAPAAPAQAAARGARILVVDDEAALVRALSETLSADGHRVVSAGSGRGAIEIIDRDDAFDLVLCDLMMPDGSGADVHAHVTREHPALAPKMVFMTAGTFRAEMRAFLGTSGNRCLYKPFTLDKLAQVVADALR